LPEVSNQSQEDFKELKQVLTEAWAGITGQDKYQMSLNWVIAPLKNVSKEWISLIVYLTIKQWIGSMLIQ
jgi:hypothetical protein